MSFLNEMNEKNVLWNIDIDKEMESASLNKIIVAEGDSWFDYPLVNHDILDVLKKDYNYVIDKISDMGDTFENMVYGTELKRNLSRKLPQIGEIQNSVSKYRPKIVLFSAGGNDFSGHQLETFLNHKDSGLPLLRETIVDYLLSVYAKKVFEDFMKVIWKIDDSISIITHGYGYAIPDGRGIVGIIGPWLKPAFAMKNITSPLEAEDIMHTLMDKFNDMLQQLDDENPNFHYLDLRPIIQREDWVNELHVNAKTFKKIASKFNDKIVELTESIE